MHNRIFEVTKLLKTYGEVLFSPKSQQAAAGPGRIHHLLDLRGAFPVPADTHEVATGLTQRAAMEPKRCHSLGKKAASLTWTRVGTVWKLGLGGVPSCCKHLEV